MGEPSEKDGSFSVPAEQPTRHFTDAEVRRNYEYILTSTNLYPPELHSAVRSVLSEPPLNPDWSDKGRQIAALFTPYGDREYQGDLLYEDVNGEVQRLLSIGVVNLVTGETMEDALDELTEALSEDGMQRYVVKAPVYEQPATQREKAPEPDEIIPYRWNARNIRIAVAGSQRRSGVTVTAFNLASWLAARGAEVAYIEVNQNRHLQLLLNIYEAAPDGEHYTIDGIDCYLTNEPDKAYQFKRNKGGSWC